MLKDDETPLTERTEMIKTGVLEELVLAPCPQLFSCKISEPQRFWGIFLTFLKCYISQVEIAATERDEIRILLLVRSKMTNKDVLTMVILVLVSTGCLLLSVAV